MILKLKNYSLLIVLLIACGSSESNEKPTNVQKLKADSYSSCLMKYVEEPCNIFTSQEIAAIANVDLSKVKMEDPYPFKFMRKQSCIYKWNSGRKDEVKTAIGMIETDIDDSVSIGVSEVIDDEKLNESSYLEWFEAKYRTLTKEEIANYQEKLDKRLANESETAQDLNKGFSKIIEKSKTVKVNGIGDSAVAQTLGNAADVTLSVLHGNLVFSVTANVIKDQETNLELAKKIAKSIMSICE